MAAYPPPQPLHNSTHPLYPYPPLPTPPPPPLPPQPHFQHPQPQPPLLPSHHHLVAMQQHQPLPFHLQSSSVDEVRTLFIAGLPGDVKLREIHNLFRDFPGFQSCQLKSSGNSNQAFAFAVFSDQQSAVSAMHTLNGLEFDLEFESTLHIDLAKSNSRTKRSRTDNDGSGSFDKKVRGFATGLRGPLDSAHFAHVCPNRTLTGLGSNTLYNGMNGHGNLDGLGIHDLNSGISLGQPAIPPSANNNACPTLFVANLGPNCTEDELLQVFSRFPGFLKLKMQMKHGAPVAFVDFQDSTCSTQALNLLQGSILYSSGHKGMRLEYAKTRMGLPKRERG
ncbi:uncharacterized protein LOC18445019 isoform X3 [Amborella trichopoda]|uniref:uncharacterized protein LOC18445019 isoform X3 n=1 Tax=Amborella trichopoda TaxID=13333 RepID=UPI0009BF1A1E|nr:uncharacterized protein LOC18445019 isoform X3 [Amborella trichopoda]|eukprot:XP_020529653.1 uncharacterized protein LOC18445019 isoform X3 [Amborella trichopoda]